MGEIQDKIEGKLEQVGGVLTDDPARVNRGELIEQRGRMKGAFERVKTRIKDALGYHKNQA